MDGVFRNIYLAVSWLGKYSATIHLNFKGQQFIILIWTSATLYMILSLSLHLLSFQLDVHVWVHMHHCRLFLLKCFPIFAVGFNVVETNKNCGIMYILGIVLMNSYNILIFLATTICSLSHSN